MPWQATFLATPILLALVIALVLFGYGLIHISSGRREPIVLLFSLLTLAAIVWTGFSALKLLHTDPAMKLLFYRFLHMGVAMLSPLSFLFVLAYTDRHQWLRPVLIGGIFFIPVGFVILLFLNPAELAFRGTEITSNGLVILRVIDGPAYMVFFLYIALLIVASLGLVLWETWRLGRIYYPQALLIALSLLTPIVFGALNAAGIPPFTRGGVNIVPTSAAISMGAAGVLLTRYRLFSLPPLAYSTAMKHAPDCLFVLNREEQVIHANENGQELLDSCGVDMGESITPLLNDMTPHDAASELIELSTREDAPAYFRVFVNDVTRDERQVGWVLILRDETTQQRQQDQLRRQNEQLDTFAMTVSHDLRNPLHVAQGRVALARDTGDLTHLEEVHAAHDRMSVMIDQLLTLAQATNTGGSREPVAIVPLVEECWDMVNQAEGSLSIDDEFDLVVLGDRERLSHVFENLLSNAIEHGGHDTTIRLGALANECGFFIEDDGPGINAEHRERIFEPGFTTQQDGTGFGLAIVGDIIRAHGWEIAVSESQAGGLRIEVHGVDLAD